MDAPWFGFVLGVFATWRVAHLLAHEDGPWDAVLRLRVALGNGVWGRLLDCFYCLSLWIAAPIAWAVVRDPVEWLLAWLGLSGAACLLDRLGRAPPAFIQPIDGDEHGLLRTETRGAATGADDEQLERRASGDGQDAAAGPLHIVR
jgi:hypothetical protein